MRYFQLVYVFLLKYVGGSEKSLLAVQEVVWSGVYSGYRSAMWRCIFSMASFDVLPYLSRHIYVHPSMMAASHP